MNLATIEMDRNVARKAFLDYRRAVRERHSKEDEQIMRGYRALAQGHQLIRLSETLRAGGTTMKPLRTRRWNSKLRKDVWVNFDLRVPRLAVIRADAKMCYTRGINTLGGCELTADRLREDLHINNKKDRARIPDGTFEPGTMYWGAAMRAIVPNVPPPLRPAHNLSGYMILWEAEWAVHPTPPEDPALLKHVGGDLYAVVAVWDLSPLERAVLQARVDA